jgi:hypothetical protein
VLIQILIIQFGGAVFGTVPLSAMEWVTVAAAAAVPVLIIGFFIRQLFSWYRSAKKCPVTI